MTIKVKMRALASLLVVSFIFVIGAAAIGIDRLHDAQLTYQRKSDITLALMEIKASAISTILLDPVSPDTHRIFSAAEDNIHKFGAELLKRAVAPTTREKAEKILALWETYDRDSQTLFQLAKTDPKAANDQLTPLYQQKFKPLQDRIESFVTEKRAEAMEAAQRAERHGERTVWLVTLPLIVVGGLMMVVMLALTRFLDTALKNIFQALDRLGTGDLTVRLPADRQDEIAEIARAVNGFVDKTHGVVSQVHRNSEEVSSIAVGLALASTQVAAGSQHQSEAATGMAAAVEQMTASIDQVAERAREAERISTQSGQLSSGGSEVIHNTVEEIRKIADSARASASVIEDLGHQSNEISSIVKVIKEVAEQTNLLALNAAIEAARAGEQGRGFAVVADEVRKLAERTTQATQEISGMIDKVQGGARTAISSMHDVVSRTDGGVQLADQAGEAIDHIKSGANQVTQTVVEIAGAIREQTLASSDIARNIEKIAQMAEENNAATAETAKTAHHLKQLASGLQEAVRGFKV